MNNPSLAVEFSPISQCLLADITFGLENMRDDGAIEELNRLAFGPARFTRAAHLIREEGGHDRALSFVARLGGKAVGTVRMTPIVIGDENGYLLGPIVVSADLKSLGLGAHLMGLAINAAKAGAAPIIVLVGDEPYYRRFGFKKVAEGDMKMPAPVNPARLLALELVDGALERAKGEVRHKNLSKRQA
nr:N-acetyltransferase [uncultured Bartonella sp.]